MTDREALYAAILDRPDDTHARLVYADYLDDHGDRHAPPDHDHPAFPRATFSAASCNSLAFSLMCE